MQIDARFRFIGEDGSLGYRTGQVYRLTLDKPGRRWPVEIISGGTACPYSSYEAFLRNWEPLPIIRASVSGNRAGDEK